MQHMQMPEPVPPPGLPPVPPPAYPPMEDPSDPNDIPVELPPPGGTDPDIDPPPPPMQMGWSGKRGLPW